MVADELVLDHDPLDNLGLFPDHKRIVEHFIKATVDSAKKRNSFNAGASGMYNLFHYGPAGTKAMKCINPTTGGSGAGLMQAVYENGKLVSVETLEDVRGRAYA